MRAFNVRPIYRSGQHKRCKHLNKSSKLQRRKPNNSLHNDRVTICLVLADRALCKLSSGILKKRIWLRVELLRAIREPKTVAFMLATTVKGLTIDPSNA